MSYEVLTPWIDNIRSKDYVRYRGLHTGLDIKADKVISYSPGVVIQVIKSLKYFLVTIQYSVDTILRYDHLKEAIVQVGDIVNSNSVIGIADRFVHFEYISTERLNSIWPVRIGKVTYFKQNPEGILDGTIVISDIDWQVVTENIGYFDPIEYMRRYY